MIKVLLTGSSGFLGTYIRKNIKHIEFIYYDRNKPSNINWNIINGVIHCAGLAHQSHNKDLTNLYYQANVELTKNLISSFLDSSAQFFIFISTATVYANLSSKNEITENDLGKNLSIYAKSKLQAEKELLKIKNKKIFILRPSVIVGPNSKGNIRLLQNLLKKKIPIPIPSKSSLNCLTDIRNITLVIEYMSLNYKEIKSGIFNVNDNIQPDTENLLRNLSKNELVNLKLIKIPNYYFIFGLKLISLIKPEMSKKISSFLFESKNISNKKISKILTLPYNSLK